MTESESLRVGLALASLPTSRRAPNRHLFVVSLSNDAIYEISGPRERHLDLGLE
jgi:hypothetical protein